MAIIIIDESLLILNSTVVLSQSFVATTKGTNCSLTEQISRHLLIVSASDADFVQSAQKEEFSLDHAVNLGKRESSKFHVIRFGMTRSKGPSDGVSLPPYSRLRKSVYTETGKQEGMTAEPRCQADGHSQLQGVAEWASPFARPSSWAGASTTPTNATQTPGSPFVRPGSRAGSNQGLTDNIQGSPLLSVSSRMFPQDNTSTSSDLIDMDLDAEVANFAGQQKQPQEPLPSTSGAKANSQVLFQPIVPAYVTPVQHRDQALFNSSLNLIDDLPRPQTLGSTARIPQPHAPHAKLLPTPYVNQVMVNQHMNMQPTQPHRIPAGTETSQQQQHSTVGMPPCPTSTQPAPLPFIQTSPADTRTKSKNGQGVKQSKSLPAEKPDVICWRCKQPEHLKRDCPMPPFCIKCRQEGHLPYKCPQQNKRNDCQLLKYRLRWTLASPTLGTNASTVGVNTNLQYAQQRLGYKRPQTVQVGCPKQALPVQVRITPICFPNRVQRIVCQQ